MTQPIKQKVEENQLLQFKTIKINLKHPKLINNTLHMNTKQTISELKNAISETTLFYLFENYHFQMNGKHLQPYLQFQTFNSDNKDLEVNIVFDPFDQRTAKHHLKKVQQILKNPSIWIVINTMKQKQQKRKEQDKLQIKQKQLNIQTCLTPNLQNPFFNQRTQNNFKQVINFLNFSGYNPPPSYRKLNGDFFYLHLRTLQSIDYHITANPRGFYINNSNMNYFDPTINPTYNRIYYNLIDLLNQISPQFKKIFEQNLQKINLSDLQKISILYNYKNKTVWFRQRKQIQHLWNANKSQLQFLSQFQNNFKDWNQIFQTHLSIADDSLIQKLNKQKSFFKLYSEFVQRATQGAKALVEGRMTPLNPLDDKSQHIYIHNSIFYSLAKQTPYDYSQQKGIQATPSVSAINIDLQNLSRLLQFQLKDIHVLHMVLIQYRGYKIISQSIIPGILSAQQFQCTKYGSIDDGKTIENDKQFQHLMTQICKKFNIDDNIQFIDSKGIKKKIAGSIQVKGILGSDKRKYILDLLRLSPRDYNFLGPNYHTCVLRSQLIDLYKQSKAPQQKNQYNVLIQHKLDIPINTNLQTGIDFVRTQITQKQQQQLKQMAKFLKQVCIPKVITALTTGSQKKYLSDSKGISKIFHKYGVNNRYLGYVLMHNLNEHPQMKIALERVILVKCLKHLFRMAMRDCSALHVSTVLCRLLNCVFSHNNQINELEGGKLQIEQKNQIQQQSKTKKKKKNKQKLKVQSIKQTEQQNYIHINESNYLNIKPSQVWEIVCNIANARYQYKFTQKITDFKGFSFPFNKLATLRDLCLNIGLKIQKKNYNLFSQNINELPFSVKNIVQIYPIPKHIPLVNKSIQKLIDSGDVLLNQYKIEEGIQIYNNAIQYLSGLYGGIHEDIALINQKIAHIYYKLGDYDSAINCLKSSVEMYDILYGEDHMKTIECISNLGLFYFSKNQKQKALYYLFKSLFLSNLSFGECYPQTIVNYMNISAIYQQNKQYQLAILILSQALEIITKIYGNYHLNTGACYTALAALHYQMNEVKLCIQYQQKSLASLKNSLKQNDARIINAEGVLNYYKQILNSKKLQEQKSIKRPLKKDETINNNNATRNTINQNDPNSERNILLKKLQQAKWNSRMGFKK